jgi:hypothetical protein
MSVRKGDEQPSLIRGLMDPFPTLRWVMDRADEHGSVKEFPFRCRVLHGAHNIDALASAQKASDKKELPGYADVYRENQSYEVIQRCMLRDEPEDVGGRKVYVPYFVSAKQAAESLTEVEAAQVLNCYHLTKIHYDLEPFDEVAAEALLEGLASEFQMTASFFLGRVPSQDYPRLIYFLARLVRSLRQEIGQTPSSSATTSESGDLTSELGTSGSIELPVARSSESETSPPTDEVLDHKTAWELANKPKDE